MKVTVAICTWNRARLLDQTLEQMRQLCIPEGVEWELLAVNNNCADGTDAVLAGHAEHLPIRRLFEPKQGKSYAANLVLEEAGSDLILWTDDDVLVDPQWLSTYVRAAGRWPNAAFFGGPIQPWFEKMPDPQLITAMPMVGDGFCGIDLKKVSSDQPITMGSRSLPFGANYAVRRDKIGRVRFAECLGPRGRARILGEETKFLRDILKTGMHGRWVIESIVKHFVPAERLSLVSLRRQLFDMGQLAAIRSGGTRRQSLTRLPLWFYRQTVEAGIGLMVHSLRHRESDFYRSFALFHMNIGRLYQIMAGIPRGMDEESFA